MRILGIDYGGKKIGIAIGDTDVRVASPYCVIENSATVLFDINDICTKEGVEQIVVGVPVGLSGGQSEQYEQARQFVERLDAAVHIPVVMENEVLSTSAAKELTKGNNRRRADDDVAAMVILQGYLDKTGQ